jgi:hypothetical protein
MIFQNCFRGDLSCFRKFSGKKINFHMLGVMCSNPYRLGWNRLFPTSQHVTSFGYIIGFSIHLCLTHICRWRSTSSLVPVPIDYPDLFIHSFVWQSWCPNHGRLDTRVGLGGSRSDTWSTLRPREKPRGYVAALTIMDHWFSTTVQT